MAWHSHIILLFPEQILDGPAQPGFAEIFGTIKKRGRPNGRRPDLGLHDYESQIMFISNIKENGKPIGSLPNGEMWFHYDECCKKNRSGHPFSI